MWSQVPVTSLSLLQDSGQVLIGQGQFLVLVSAGCGDILARLQVFRGAVVHSLQRCGASWLVRGGKSVAIVTIEEARLEVSVPETVHEDWVMASHLSADSVHLLTAHNKLVTVASVRDLGKVMESSRAECGPCILYSGLLHCPEPGSVTVLAGTVFGKVIIWNGVTGEVINSLEGHYGVIFSVTYSGNTVVTTSDDRSSLVYRCGEAGLTEVSLAHRLRGHTARVFRSLVCEARDIVITAGEDGRVMTWGLTSGDLVQSEETNGGSAVWSLEISDEDVVSGGGDGSVTRTRISDGGCDKDVRNIGGLQGKPRIVKCVGEMILILDDEGNLYSYGSAEDQGTLIFCDNRLSGYCLLEATEDHVVMGGLSGLVISGTRTKSCLENVKIKQLVDGKIFSLGLFCGGESIVCDKEGKLTLTDTNLDVICVGELPVMKDRWFTASARLGAFIILGDRCGGVHFLTRTGASLSMRESFPRLHGRHGVTQLCVDDEVVWSSGRDGQVRCYFVSEAGARLVQTVRAPRDWVAGVRRVMGQLSVLTWRGDSLSVRTLPSDDLVTSVQCGGGHRSWGVREAEAGGELVYIKDGRVLVTQMWSGQSRVLVSGGHTQQVNTVRCGEGLIVTGSEDTFIRVYRADTGEQLAVLSGHLSSIKCLRLTVRPDTRDLVLVSGGGRAELRLWSLVTVETRLCCSPLATVMLRPGDGGRGNKKAWRLAQAETQADGETRFMSVDAVWAGQRLVVAVACSDSSVRVYTQRPGEGLEAVCEARQHQHCLLQIRMVPDTDKLVTGTTGGHLSVWTLSEDRLGMETEVKVHQSGVNCLDLRRSGDAWDVVSGGDDTSLVLSRYSCGQITVIWRSDLSCGHTTQLTGLRMVGDYIVTSGVDQRLILWRHSRTEAGERVSWVRSKCVSVADVSSLDLVAEDTPRLGVVLVGVGMERINIIKEEDC